MRVRELRTILSALDDNIEVFVCNHHQDRTKAISAKIVMLGNTKDKTTRIAIEIKEAPL